jgi:hypothetical protein
MAVSINEVEREKNMSRLLLCALLAGISLAGEAQAFGQKLCKPILAIKEAHFSAMQPPTLERKWTAIVAVDASRCATTSGLFEIEFTRLKENGFETNFQSHFTWRPISVEVSVDFWADEAVEGFWLNNVAACPCRGGTMEQEVRYEIFWGVGFGRKKIGGII